MKWEAFHWTQSQPLAEDYNHHFTRVQELYDFNPWEEGSLQRRADWVRSSGTAQADRAALIQALKEYNHRLNQPPEALRAVEALESPDALAVVGGQQAGLFGGPLLVLYKAITILQVAKQAADQLSCPVIPVFWIAGEDHDWDEANHMYYFGHNLTLQKIRLNGRKNVRTSVSRTVVTSSDWMKALRQLDHSLMDSPHKGELLLEISNTLEDDPSLSLAFGRWMSKLFGKYGLVLTDSDDPNLRKLESPFFEKLISRNTELRSALKNGEDRVKALGYHPQVSIEENQAHLFLFHEDTGERQLLFKDGEIFTDKRGFLKYSPNHLGDLAFCSPERFSNNVMTRPLMQEFLFPVLCTVLGGAEIAYWGLTREAFHLFGMKLPILIPRAGVTLVTDSVHKWMKTHAIRKEDIMAGLEARKEEWLREQRPVDYPGHFEKVRRQFKEIYDPLLDSISAMNKGLKTLGEINMDHILKQVRYLEEKTEQAHRTKYDKAIRQWERLTQSLTPMGKPQERVLNACAFLNQYGNAWLNDLVETQLPLGGKHSVYYI